MPAAHRAYEEAKPPRPCVPRTEPWNEAAKAGGWKTRLGMVALTEKIQNFLKALRQTAANSRIDLYLLYLCAIEEFRIWRQHF